MSFIREQNSSAIINTQTEEFIRHKEMRKKAEKFNRMAAEILELQNTVNMLSNRIALLEKAL